MAFIFLEWLTGESLNKVMSTITEKSLQQRLDDVVDRWADALPPHCNLVSVAMYLDIHPAGMNTGNTALETLRNQLKNGNLPSQQTLFDSLLEQWLIKSTNGGQ